MARPDRFRSPPVTDPDAELVRALQCDAPDSFGLLLQRYQNPIYAFVRRLIDDPLEAEDVTQDIFVKVFRKVHSFRHESSFKTWLYRIAVREASNARRWFSRHRRREVAIPTNSSQACLYDERMTDPGASPFQQVERREHRDILNRALGELNPRYRQAVVLRDVSGLSYNEIAETLGISLGTVKSRILRGREALKRELLRSAPALAHGGARWQTE